MYKSLIDWEELDYIVSRLEKGLLTTKALSQRIYREEDFGKVLTYKLAQFIYKKGK